MADQKVWSIYCVTNTINGKLYIGVTSNPVHRRWYGHAGDAVNKNRRTAKDRFLWMAIRKYGRDVFSIETIAKANTRKEAMELEMQAISIFDTRAPAGYNMTIGGEGVFPRPPISEETREKLRLSHLGKKHTPEQRAAISRANKARTHSAAELANLKLRQGVPQSAETKRKISLIQRGKKRGPYSASHRAAMRQGRKRALEKRGQLSLPLPAPVAVEISVRTEEAHP